jgi:hypothetical protein
MASVELPTSLRATRHEASHQPVAGHVDTAD